MKITKSDMQNRLKEATAEIEAIKASTVPLREERDKFIQEMRAKKAEYDAKLREMEKPLFDLQNEIGMLHRALGARILVAEGTA